VFDRGMVPALLERVIDNRGRHRLDPGGALKGDDVLAFLGRWPDKPFLMLNFYDPPGKARLDKPACRFDIVRFVGGCGARMPKAIQTCGADRLVFGSSMLLRYAKPTLIALEICDLSHKDREAIQWRNLARLVPEMT